jgi:hypothetical protein
VIAQLSRFQTNRSGYAFFTGLLTFTLGGAGAVLFAADPPNVPLAADTTIWRFVLLTAYISMAVSLIGYRLLAFDQDKISSKEKLAQLQARKDWLARIIVSFAVAWILSVVCQAVFLMLIGKLFIGAELPRLVMMLLFAIYSAVLGFGVAFFIVGVDDLELNWLIILLGGGGFLFSTTLVANPDWWARSVSALGIDGGSGTFFNVTVIAVGLVALTLVRDLILDLKLLTEANMFAWRSYNFIRFGLTGLGLGIVGVGLFPTEGLRFSHELHMVSAYVMAVLCILGMLLLSLIAPNIYPSRFVYFSAGLGALCILAIVAHFTGFIGFVPMELTLFALFGAWVFFFRAATKQFFRQYAAEVLFNALMAAFSARA